MSTAPGCRKQCERAIMQIAGGGAEAVASRREDGVANFEWLLAEGADLAVPASPRFVAADENWQATIERVPLASTLHVFLNDIRVHRDLRAEPMNHRPADYLTGQVTIAGRSDIDLLDGTLASATPESSLLYRVPGGLPVFTFKAGTRYHSAGYTLDPSRIERLLEGEVPAVLRRLVDPNLAQSCLVTSPGDPLMRTLAGSLFNPRLTGPLRRLMMEGVVLQLVGVQGARGAGPRGGGGGGGGRAAAVARARQPDGARARRGRGGAPAAACRHAQPARARRPGRCRGPQRKTAQQRLPPDVRRHRLRNAAQPAAGTCAAGARGGRGVTEGGFLPRRLHPRLQLRPRLPRPLQRRPASICRARPGVICRGGPYQLMRRPTLRAWLS